MDETIRNYLEKDLDKINGRLEEILRTKNFLVIKPAYDSPTCIGRDVPLTHRDGLFQHYARIRDVLTTALETGRVPEDLVVPEHKKSMASYYFRHLPFYVKDLVVKGE